MLVKKLGILLLCAMLLIVPVSVAEQAQATSVEEQCFQYLTGTMKLNSAGASGILANIYAESRFNPRAGTVAYGLCQWYKKKGTVVSWCKRHGYSGASAKGQMAFLYHELSSRYGGLLRRLRSVPNSAAGARKAGYMFCVTYERPANKVARGRARGSRAASVYFPRYKNRTGGSARTDNSGIEAGTEDTNAMMTMSLSAKENGDDLTSITTMGTYYAGWKLTNMAGSALKATSDYEVTVTLSAPSGSDYTTSVKNKDTGSVALDFLEEGTYELDITVSGAYTLTSSRTYTMDNQTSVDVTLSASSFVYTGEEQVPQVTVMSGDQVINSDLYTVTYPEASHDIGMYDITVTLTGTYAGVYKRSYAIVPKVPDVTSLSVTESGFALTSDAAHLEVIYSEDMNFAEENTKVADFDGGDASVTDTTLNSIFVKVRAWENVNGDILYSEDSDIMSVSSE